MKLLMAAFACVCLVSCAGPSNPGYAAGHTVTLAKEKYLINQLTASTWTISATNSANPVGPDSSTRASLLEAIERASGCKVTDSNYSRQGMQLDAQVECGKPLKN